MTTTTRLKPYAPLLAIAVAGLALRIFITFAVHPMCPFELSDVANLDSARQYIVDAGQYGDECFYLRGDALAIYLQGILTSEGNAFGNPFSEIWGQESTILAGKPPVMTLVVAGMNVAGAGDPDAIRLVSAFAGAAAVFVIGLVAWRVAGRRAGLIAGGIAAAYPMLWINDWRMMPETYLALFTALTLLAAYHFWVKPRPASAVLLGGAIGLALMARVEMLLLAVVLLVPLCWRLPRRSSMAKVKLGLLSTLATAAVLLPWSVFLVSQYGGAQFLQTGNGTAVLNGTCDSTYYGDYLGYLDFACFDAEAITAAGAARTATTPAEAEQAADRVYRELAFDYMGENRARLPVVAAARVGRLWDVYRPVQNVELNAALEGRGQVDSWLGLISYACLVPLAAFGGWAMWRRRLPVGPLVAMAVVVTITAAGTFGLTRYRTAADVALVVAAAVGIEFLLRRRSTATTADEPLGDVERAAARFGPRPDRSARQRRELQVLGGVASVAALVLVAWSATVAKPEPEIPTPEVQVAELCAYAGSYGLLSTDFLANLDRPGIVTAIAHFRELQPMAPPELQADITAVIATLEAIRDSGLEAAQFLVQFPAEANTGFAAGVRLLQFADANCPK